MNCKYCNIDENKIIYKNKFWTLVFHKQDYLGRRCVMATNRHVDNFNKLSNEELISLREMLKSLEDTPQDLYGCSMLNWCCNMNNVYSSNNPEPHVHIHIRPRYKQPVIINNIKYTDNEFGAHYDRFAKIQFNEETIKIIYNQIKTGISKYINN